MHSRGWRVSEECNYTMDNLDIDARVAYIQHRKNGTPKTHPIAPDELKALKAWLKVRESYKVSADSRSLFLSERGSALDRWQVFCLLRKYGEIAGLDVMAHPHMLRHACGYALANAGHDNRAIQT
jgi:type 1 fimbriae regulatory protein FimB